jgi:hypothetical protein
LKRRTQLDQSVSGGIPWEIIIKTRFMSKATFEIWAKISNTDIIKTRFMSKATFEICAKISNIDNVFFEKTPFKLSCNVDIDSPKHKSGPEQESSSFIFLSRN